MVQQMMSTSAILQVDSQVLLRESFTLENVNYVQ